MNNPAPPRTYSSFWPLQLFLTVVILWISYQIGQVRMQQVATQQALTRLLPQVQAAKSVKQKLIALAQDLKKASQDSSTAGRILKESQIQVEEPSTGPGTSSGGNP